MRAIHAGRVVEVVEVRGVWASIALPTEALEKMTPEERAVGLARVGVMDVLTDTLVIISR
jgi:hypothetical protein